MKRAVTLTLSATLAALATGCIIVDDNDAPDVVVVGNAAPYVAYADAGCYWSDWEYDYVWWFEAEVWDDDGYGDIEAVYADIYDARGNWVDTFELYDETNYPELWFSDWLQYYSYMDCSYGGYVVDIVAYDWSGAYDVTSVTPMTSW